MKAQGLMGKTVDPVPGKTKPTQDMKPLPDRPPDQRTGILTEAFTHFARSLNKRPEQAIKYLESRKLIIKDSQSALMQEHYTRTKKLPRSRSSFTISRTSKPDKFGREESY